jgi:hypothetical protein
VFVRAETTIFRIYLRRDEEMKYVYFLVMLCGSAAASSIINGGFEADLEGWHYSGYSCTTTSSMEGAGISQHSGWTAIDPYEGNAFALLGSGDRSIGFSEITQTITFEQGNILRLVYYFATTDYLVGGGEQFNDYGSITLAAADGSIIAVARADVEAVPSFGSTAGWQHASHTFSEADAGTYILTCRVQDACDTLLASYLAVDGVHIEAPEPTMIFGMTAGAALAAARKRQ